MTIMNKLLVLFLTIIYLHSKAQVPYGLNSYVAPNTATVLLDFDGQTITDPYWMSFENNQPIICGPDTLLTTAQMIRIFNLVAEDFRPFTINITTDSTVFFATPTTRRMRVVITQYWQWYAALGGVAYIDSWKWGGLGFGTIPCFVFPTLLDGNDKRVAEAISHEVGHTLGLYHQSRYKNPGTDSCSFLDEYHPGRGTIKTETSWAPIMGVGYFRNLTLWHNDRTLECGRFQDDIAVITNAANFVKLRTDDVGNSQSTAKLILDQNYLIDGIINMANDIDYYRFDYAKTGRFAANAKPYSPGPRIYFSAFDLKDNTPNQGANVDLKLQLYRGNIFISEYNPELKLDAAIDTVLNPGVYYLVVGNSPNANIYNYGMLGSYNISGIYDGISVLDINNEWQYNYQSLVKSIIISNGINGGTYFVNIPNISIFNEIKIFSISGSLLKTIRCTSNITKIDINDCASGVYIVNVGGVKSFKIIKHD